MNVASLELSKELYELSLWEGDGWWWFEGKPVYTDLEVVREKLEITLPAYPLGYLLRKLPKFVDGAEFWLTNDGFSWTAGYATDKYADGKFHFTRSESADTPEDAACKLCIELFKQGVLS